MSVDSLTSEARDAFAGYAEPEERPPFRTYAALTAILNAGFAGALVAAKRSDRLPASVSAPDVVLIGTASHKLSRLLAKDKVTSFLRAPFTEYQGRGGPAEVEERARGDGTRRAIGELLICPVLPGALGVGRLPRRPDVRAARDPGGGVDADGADRVGLPADRLQGGGGPRPRRVLARPRRRVVVPRTLSGELLLTLSGDYDDKGVCSPTARHSPGPAMSFAPR